jgi:hypothetical protein
MNSDERAPAVPTLSDLVRQQDPRVPPPVLFKAGRRRSIMNCTRTMRGRLRLEPVSYEALRQLVLRHDGWRCQSRGAISNLEIHHKEVPEPLWRRFGIKPHHPLCHMATLSVTVGRNQSDICATALPPRRRTTSNPFRSRRTWPRKGDRNLLFEFSKARRDCVTPPLAFSQRRASRLGRPRERGVPRRHRSRNK